MSPRTRIFRRVHLSELDDYEASSWRRAEREDGSASFTLYEHGKHAVVLVEERDDFADELYNSLFWRSA